MALDHRHQRVDPALSGTLAAPTGPAVLLACRILRWPTWALERPGWLEPGRHRQLGADQRRGRALDVCGLRTRSGIPKGRLISYQGPGGEGYAVYDPADPDNPQADPYTEAGHIKGLRYTYTYAGSPLREYLDFSYATGADGHERLAAATLRRQEGDSAVENVQRVLFVHQLATATGSSSSSSHSGCPAAAPSYDRGTVTHQVDEHGAWEATGTTYRQHYLAGEVGGVTGALKYDLDAEAYERLQDDPAVSDPLTASAAWWRSTPRCTRRMTPRGG